MVGPPLTVLITTRRVNHGTRAERNEAWKELLSVAIEQLRPLRAHHVELESHDVANFWTHVDQIRPTIVIVMEPDNSPFLTRIRAHRRAALEPIVLSGYDASSISLTAATLVAVNQRREATGVARVLLAGTDRLPGLSSLLALANVGELTLWNSTDVAVHPLRTVVGGVDVVINLLERDDVTALSAPAGTAHHPDDMDTAGPGGQQPVVLEPDWLTDALRVLPGLAHTLATLETDVAADLTSLDLDYHDVCFACALELVMATPRDHAELPGPTASLSERIAEATARALPPPGDMDAHQAKPSRRDYGR